MAKKTMSTIYQPKGRAREYAPYALNLYTSCAHSCLYCYSPRVLHMTREQFAKPQIRDGVLGALEKYLAGHRGLKGPVLLSFTSDCYQPMEKDVHLTRDAIEMLGEAGVKIRLLTKAPALALMLDGTLFEKHNVDFGVSLVFVKDSLRRHWEPNAETVMTRVAALQEAHGRGLSTWVSLEPVIDPEQALKVIELGDGLLEGCIDRWMVGKLNHDAELEHRIDEEYGWSRFLEEALTMLARQGASYYIKADLWGFAGDRLKAAFPQASQSVLALIEGKPDVEESFGMEEQSHGTEQNEE